MVFLPHPRSGRARFAGAIFACAWILGIGGAAPARAGDPLSIGPGAIVARVRDESGRPVPGALVAADGPASRDATTSLGGIVTLLDLPLGTYDVRVSRDGYDVADARVRVGKLDALHVTDLRVTLASFAGLHARVGTSTLRARPHADGDPTVAHALASASSIAIVPEGSASGAAAVTLLGTNANETRVELDGIPLAGGASGAAALAARDGLGVDAIEVARGPGSESATPRGAIGGIVNYRSIVPGGDDGASASAGYSSYFGYFQQYRLARRHDRLSVAFDLSAGDANVHAQTLKAEFALSKATSLGVASYGIQTSGFGTSAGYVLSAPIFAADVRTTIGRASLRLRAYSSSSSASARSSAGVAVAQIAANPLLANERLEGTQADLALPFGDGSEASTTFDRRNVLDVVADGAPVRRSYTTETLRADVQLTRAARLSLSDALSSGSDLTTRNDPQATLALRAGEATTVRASVASAYAVAPAQAIAAESLAAFVRPYERYSLGAFDPRPETAVGYRLEIEQRLNADSRVYGDAYDVRARDRFAALSDARTDGVELGYDASPASGRVVLDGYVDLAKNVAFGDAQGTARYAYAPETSAQLERGAQALGDPYSKARLEATYRSPTGAEVRVAEAYYGANNAFSTGAVALADASLRIPLDPFELRFGIWNAFGAPVTPQGLAPYFGPRQMTVSLQHLFGSAP
jgi:hypothetical protein